MVERQISKRKWFIKSFAIFKETYCRFNSVRFTSLVKHLLSNNNTETTSISLIFRIFKFLTRNILAAQ